MTVMSEQQIIDRVYEWYLADLAGDATRRASIAILLEKVLIREDDQ